MISLKVNGLPVSVEPGSTVLEAAQFLGFPIPTLCHMEGLSPYGACRLCVVEIGEGPRAKLVSSCTYPAEEGLVVRTASTRVVRARKMVLELLLASCPQSKVIQDLASAHEVRQQRFRQEQEDCILCGRCVRMCREQMAAGAIGFTGRGERRRIEAPFGKRSEACRLCGGCIYVCPAGQRVAVTGEAWPARVVRVEAQRPTRPIACDACRGADCPAMPLSFRSGACNCGCHVEETCSTLR